MNEQEQIRAERARLRQQYCAAYDHLSRLLFDEDPIGINYEVNTDEYEPEVGTILPRLSGCESVDTVRSVVYEEFVKWFDAITAGPPQRYDRIAHRIWEEVVPLLA